MNPLDILDYQYDIVCNGIELSSGAIRNHKPEIMYKAFEIAGYDRSLVDEKFSGMITAFRYGAPRCRIEAFSYVAEMLCRTEIQAVGTWPRLTLCPHSCVETGGVHE